MTEDTRHLSDQALIASLCNSQLTRVQVDPQLMKVLLYFSFGLEAQGIVVDLQNTAHIAISKSPNDDDLPAVVGIATLAPLDHDRAAILTKLAFPFREMNDPSVVFTYPDTDLYHFHMEGDICVDVVLGKYEVRLTDGRVLAGGA